MTVDLTPSETMRGLPLVDSADLDDFVEAERTRRTLTADELAEKFGTVSRNRDGDITTELAGDGFFNAEIPDLPDLEQRAAQGQAEALGLIEDLTPRSFTPMNARRISDGTVWPYRAIGLIAALDRFDNIVGSCSAALIGPRTVLSAAHCFYDHDEGWIDDVLFVPGVTDLESFGPPLRRVRLGRDDHPLGLYHRI